MNIVISDSITQLLAIVKRLHETYPEKHFTLDGRLVGDLGEVIVQEMYDVTLHKTLEKHHDGITSDGRHVQIKATMKKDLTFPADHIPDYYLGIKIHEDGTVTEIFNGPGKTAWEAVKNRKLLKTNLHSVSIETFRRLNLEVRTEDRIPRRNLKEQE